MITLVMNPHPNNYVVFCENEASLDLVLSEFEAFLQTKQLRIYVKIGRVVPHKHSFEFSLAHADEETKTLILNYLKPSKENAVTKYRVLVNHGYILRHYPSNDLRLALILFKAIDQETAINIDVQLYEYDPDDLNPDVEGGWKVWRDKDGKTANEVVMRIIDGEIIPVNLSE